VELGKIRWALSPKPVYKTTPEMIRGMDFLIDEYNKICRNLFTSDLRDFLCSELDVIISKRNGAAHVELLGKEDVEELQSTCIKVLGRLLQLPPPQ
jgi:hypothetical protein